ncbi:MAG TPA: HAD family hydrolase [Methylomusa anaerophila]|uniref:Pyrophosphatase PpaX n=1 Tax=Methylomusa anaerophila TaxID=1930071 RepID=A0A348AEN0_9FIRM|nr:HAD family hydrolase [Methylomusa anaerophila]BBB89528.1 pyrophosphatase PpaX [Methylomusa anaerophila]HML90102.1 HAD family hydrolase [Methylomusa anaerophila]
MRIRGIIFDMDGTLLDTLPVCYSGFRSTLLKFLGREYSDAEISALFGPTEEGVFKKLLPDKWEESLQHYLAAYDEAHCEYSEPFPGIKAALTLLTERNIRLAIVSGKGPGTMAISLRHSGLGELFEVVQTGSEHGADKPAHIKKVLSVWNYNPRDVAYIGDTAYDIKAAKAAGTVSIGAVWADTANAQCVKDMEPDLSFESVESFVRWIKDNI